MTQELIQTIFARRSIRKFTEESVSKEDIKTLLETAMAAPTAMNRKPWHFVVINDRKALDTLARLHPYGKMLYEAPLCIAVCGAPGILPIAREFWVQDCAAATENLLLAATSLGLGAVWLGVYPISPKLKRVATARDLLGIPKNVLLLNLIAVGHPAEAKEPRTQYDETRVHWEHW